MPPQTPQTPSPQFFWISYRPYRAPIEPKDFKEGDFDPKVPEPVVEAQDAHQETLESPSKKARTEETPA